MNKFTLLLATILCVAFSAQAQNDFMYSAGASLLAASGSQTVDGVDPNTGSPTSTTTNISGGGWGITLWPRLNVVQHDNNSISIGVPATIGFSGSANSQTGGSFSFLLDAPLTVDYNIGHGSSKDNDSNFGGFFGLGVNYFSSAASSDDPLTGGDVSSIHGAGFLLHGGVRFPVKEKSITIRLSYSIGSISVVGGGLIYNFGMGGN